MPADKKQICCDCHRCGGVPVSQSKYRRHAKYRVTKFTPEFNQYLESITANNQEGSVSSSSRKRSAREVNSDEEWQSGEGIPGPSKRTRYNEDDEEGEGPSSRPSSSSIQSHGVTAAAQPDGYQAIGAYIAAPPSETSQGGPDTDHIMDDDSLPPLIHENDDGHHAHDGPTNHNALAHPPHSSNNPGNFTQNVTNDSNDDPPAVPHDENGHQEAGEFEDPDVPIAPTLEELKIAQHFIDAIKVANLDDSGLSPGALERLRNPLPFPLENELDPDLRLSLDWFISTLNASGETYDSMREGLLRRNPDDGVLSYDQVRKRVAELSGVVPLLSHMCVNTCIAFTGPFSDRLTCPECGEQRYEYKGRKEVARREFYTLPIGPQLQALWRSPESAEKVRYRSEQTQKIIEDLTLNEGLIDVYEDVYHGSDYIAAVQAGKIKSKDMVLMLSIDGAQLYSYKHSECWIYIWIVLDHSPEDRYKKRYVLPGGFIPGPNKPKNPDSFLFPGIHHLAGIQNEGLRVWDASTNSVFTSDIFFALGTADSPGMTFLNGFVGHNGGKGCRTYCGLQGRRKNGGSQYYPVLLKPLNYSLSGCSHPDVSLREMPVNDASQRYQANLKKLLQASADAQYRKLRLETGIVKPSLFSGLHEDRIFGFPNCFAIDLMHLISLNIPDLLINLWRGTLHAEPTDDKRTWDWAVLKGDVWKAHGSTVAAMTPYLPGSFDRPPRDIAEKISSGYKAWEFLMYLIGMGPALLRGILPEKYWLNFCKLVYGVRILHQRRVTREQIADAHTTLILFEEEFELLYYQRRPDRIHFIRQSIHLLCHMAPETLRIGPLACTTQFTMERTIGNLGEEIKQPSNPFANLSERGLIRSQVNALKAMIPGLEKDKSIHPRGSIDLQDGYILLRARDRYPKFLDGIQAETIRHYVISQNVDIPNNWDVSVARWARLRLPNGQIARSAWKENKMDQVRMARNVKIQCEDNVEFAEVQFYFRIEVHQEIKTLALISRYSAPDASLLKKSYNTIWACQYQGDDALKVIDVKAISAVVAMPPLPLTPEETAEENSDEKYSNRHYLVEKPGLDVAYLGGMAEDDDDEEAEEDEP